MSDASEYSESDFTMQVKMSNAEPLQQPTHSESTERKSTLLTNEKVHNFFRSQQASKQTIKKTTFPDELSDN